MQIIISHVNTDFDALASMIAAKKLYPEAQLVLPKQQDDRVTRFLNIYRDLFDFKQETDIDWANISSIVLVDVASLTRIGQVGKDFPKENVEFIVYDHHPYHPNNVQHDRGKVEPLGAAVTLLLEEIQAKGLPITTFEATLFGLGIYTDTGNFLYKQTTARDMKMAVYLMEHGMDVNLIHRFSEQILDPSQQQLFEQLREHIEVFHIDGLKIIVSAHTTKPFITGLSLLTHTLMEQQGADAAISVVKMKNHVQIVGRASSNRINLLPLIKAFGGGGHQQACSATAKNSEMAPVYETITAQLPIILQPPITAEQIMAHPVKTLSADTPIAEASRLMYRYGHSGYPIMENDQLVGVITRRDLDKGNHHGLGHAPVKAYMTTDLITISKDTPIEEIQRLIIEHNIGRLPVLEGGHLCGIVTRTNVIQTLHDDPSFTSVAAHDDKPSAHYQQLMKEQLPPSIYALLQDISQTTHHSEQSVYVVGGFVRDLLLKQANDDIDLVVEGDGIGFAKRLQSDYGGEVIVHDSFGTATWTHPSGVMIDITSSRLEFYERPASLPDVEQSSLAEDLQRRDFTINAMAICLNEASFGEIIDPFGGQFDLQTKTIKVLHNMSFIEDPTRILRAIRFEQRFSFSMDEQTEKLALHSIAKIRALSSNRIHDQLDRLYKEGQPTAITARLFDLQFWTQFGVAETHKQKSCRMTKELGRNYKHYLEERQPGWFHYMTIPFYISKQLTQLSPFALTKTQRQFVEDLLVLQQHENDLLNAEKLGDYHPLFHSFDEEILLYVWTALNQKDGTLFIRYIQTRKQLQSYFDGKDLMTLGLKPGPHFSKLFLQLEMSQLNGEVTSKEEALQWLTHYRQTLGN